MEKQNELMNTKSVFLTKDGFGISTTSANYLANLAKEVVQEKKISMENISFVNSTILYMDRPESLDYEKAHFDLKTLNDDIKSIGEMNTFIAWMREGIKMKKELMDQVDGYMFHSWLLAKGIELDQVIEDDIVEGSYIEDLSIGERLRMIRSEAVAAAYGKLIHPDSPISKARKKLMEVKIKPVQENHLQYGRVSVTTYTPVVEVEEVDKVYLKLQNEQRKAEKELNAIKFEGQESDHKLKMEAKQKYERELEEYNSRRSILYSQYQREIEALRRETSLLKIVVPESLMNTYTYLNGLGK